MWILCLYFLLCILLAYHYLKKPLTKQQLLIISGIVILILALSFPIGRDINAYLSTFERANGFMDTFKYHMSRNFGFNALMVISKWFSSNAYLFRIVVNLIITSIFAYVIYQNSRNILLSWALVLANGLFVVYFGSAIRQALAMGIFLIAYFSFYLKGKKIGYLVFSLLAFSFHEAAVVMLVIPIFDWLYQKFNKPKRFYLIFGVLALLSFGFVSFIMPKLFNIFKADSVFTHFLSYFKSSEFSLVGLLLRVCMIIANAFLYMIASNKTNEDKSMFNVLFLSFILYLSFSNFSIFSRIADFLGCIEIIFVPSMLSKIANKKLLCLSLIGIFALTTVMFVVDIREVCAVLASKRIIDYPYISIFDFDKISFFLTQI